MGIPLSGQGKADVASLGGGGAIRRRRDPIKKVERMIKRHWDGVIDGVLTNVTNARSRATNAKTQWMKRLG